MYDKDQVTHHCIQHEVHLPWRGSKSAGIFVVVFPDDSEEISSTVEGSCSTSLTWPGCLQKMKAELSKKIKHKFISF